MHLSNCSKAASLGCIIGGVVSSAVSGGTRSTSHDTSDASASIPSTGDNQLSRYQDSKMGGTQSEVSKGASQVPDDKAPGRDVRNELASTPSAIVSDVG